MTWEKFYLICFLVGFVLSMISFLMGSLHFHIHIPGHAHLPHFSGAHAAPHGAATDHAAAGHAAPHAHAATGAKVVPGKTVTSVHWFNYFTVLAFVAWFGAAGFLLVRHHFGAAISLVLAIGSGLFGGAIVFFFFAKVLMPYDRPLNDADFEMVGVIARVSMPIRERGVGEIIFLQAETRRCAGARSDTGEAIPKGTEVVVTRYDKGMAWVKEWDKFVNEDGASEKSTSA